MSRRPEPGRGAAGAEAELGLEPWPGPSGAFLVAPGKLSLTQLAAAPRLVVSAADLDK